MSIDALVYATRLSPELSGIHQTSCQSDIKGHIVKLSEIASSFTAQPIHRTERLFSLILVTPYLDTTLMTLGPTNALSVLLSWFSNYYTTFLV